MPLPLEGVVKLFASADFVGSWSCLTGKAAANAAALPNQSAEPFWSAKANPCAESLHYRWRFSPRQPEAAEILALRQSL